jgi:putative DNA primase/helicase
MPRPEILTRSQGKWQGILRGVGVQDKFLTGKNGPCPFCGGKDRFRFTDHNGDGRWHCSAENINASGFDFVMRWLNIDWREACKEIEKHIGAAPFVMPRAENSRDVVGARMAWMWRIAAQALTGFDLVSRYLRTRGIEGLLPHNVKYLPPRVSKTSGLEDLPGAMVARFIAPDNSRAILHTTALVEPGKKADVPKVKRYAMGATIPAGGAVRLMPFDETLGVAEGIETALSAAALCHVPVWAALDAGNLMRWQPPLTVKRIIIFADNDVNLVGQQAAEVLRSRLCKTLDVEVRLPIAGCKDMNDQLRL